MQSRCLDIKHTKEMYKYQTDTCNHDVDIEMTLLKIPKPKGYSP
jgi:hypothetical protein